MNKNTLRASALVLVSAALLAGCQTPQGTNTAVGTGVGAAVGAGLGNLIGGHTAGTGTTISEQPVASSQPIASDATAQGRAQNRRVEILLHAPNQQAPRG